MELPDQAPDILAFLKCEQKWIGDELDLSQIQAGDQLLVRTRNTLYLFRMVDSHHGMLSTNRANRPSGSIHIQGCTFGRSSLIKPGHLFCGGALEIVYLENSRVFTTSPIEEIQLVTHSSSGVT